MIRKEFPKILKNRFVCPGKTSSRGRLLEVLSRGEDCDLICILNFLPQIKFLNDK